ncbi:hypothetical protein SCMU_06170 [Sinomonas cyclohexanicum]|uniref:DUF3311 domain-containing protein n=1 Tax=Sinomonas cyclohexanicum TaxID=322009 RepID=A0ABM7PRG3_SINCY|nr:DUF3311 domain-containing protein [Corynebacterium cyclohexanicum]BCT74775.1 hypothetical protein SCMU_06170 [Corynebacterium cyclohexanicum]
MSESTAPTRDTPTRGPAKPLPYVVAGVLLAVAIVLPLMPQLYSFDGPRWGGMPFFYWYQLVWVPISAALSGAAYWLVTGEDRRRRAAARGVRPAGGGPAPRGGTGGSSPGAGGPGGGGKHTASSDGGAASGEGGEAR